jgi:hypothetical protein
MCRGEPVTVTFPERREVNGKYVMKDCHVTMSANIKAASGEGKAEQQYGFSIRASLEPHED